MMHHSNHLFFSPTRFGCIWLAHSWFNSYVPERVPILYYRNVTRVQMFYFLNTVHYTIHVLSTSFSLWIDSVISPASIFKTTLICDTKKHTVSEI